MTTCPVQVHGEILREREWLNESMEHTDGQMDRPANSAMDGLMNE